MRRLTVLVVTLVAAGMVAAQPARTQPLPDVPAGHWAYEALAELAAAGLVEGYPDGTFKGERTLTRYEMAQIVARVLAKIRQAKQRAAQAERVARLRELPPPPPPEVRRADLDRVDRLVREFRGELAQAGVRVTAIEEELGRLRQQVAELRRIRVSGYAKLDIIAGSTLTRSDAPGPSGIPLSTDPESRIGETRFGARQSRIGLTYTDTFGNLRLMAFIQGDFFGLAGSPLVSQGHSFRLRHAMARLDFPSRLYLIAGQFWTAFMTLDAYPDVVDFNGPTGALFARQPQLRVGWPLASGSALELAIENHTLQSITTPAGAAAVRQDEALPQLTGRLFWRSSSLYVEVGGTVGQNRFLFPSGAAPTVSNSGFHISARWDSGPFYLIGHYQWLNGANRFSAGEFPDILVDPATQTITNIGSQGWYAYAGWKIAPKWTLQVGYSRNELRDPGALSAVASSVNSTLQGAHVTLWWDVARNTRVGFEYQNLQRVRLDGVRGDHNRFQVGVFLFY